MLNLVDRRSKHTEYAGEYLFPGFEKYLLITYSFDKKFDFYLLNGIVACFYPWQFHKAFIRRNM